MQITRGVHGNSKKQVRARFYTAIVLGAFLLAGLAGLLNNPQISQAAPAQQTRDTGGQCGGSVTNTLAVKSREHAGYSITQTTQADLSICTTGEVEVKIQPACPVCPGGVRILFVHAETPDRDWQEKESRRILDEVEDWARKNEMDLDMVSGAVVEYNNSDARERTRFTNNLSRVRSNLRAGNGYTSDMSQLPRAVQKGITAMNRERGNTGSKECELVVAYAYTKEHHATNEAAMMEARSKLSREYRERYMIGCPINPGAWYCKVAPKMPPNRRNYSEYQESGKLMRAAKNILDGFPRDAALRKMSFTQILAPGIEIIEDSAQGGDEPPLVEAQEDGQTKVVWSWDRPDAAKAVSVTFEVKPLEGGPAPITGELVLTDTSNRTQVREAPELQFNIIVEPCSTPTPVPPTPTVPPSSTPTATSTSTQTASPTITPSPTKGVWTIYIPMIKWDEPCIPESIFTDVVLVLDMSTSMYRETRNGRSKHAAALDAAKAFVDLLSLEPDPRGGHDQVGIVGFNGSAWTGIGMNSDRSATEAAIDGLLGGIAQGTRLDLALAQAQSVVDQGPRIAENQPVIILLTDGLPNRVPFGEGSSHPECPTQECTVLHYASTAKNAGSRIFTVGLGQPEDILFDLMRDAASDPADFFYAPDGEDLADIYREIAGRIIECP